MWSGMFVEVFGQLKDPRVKRSQKHLFLEILGLALFAVLAGAQRFTEIEDFCKHHVDWLKNYFMLPNGISPMTRFAVYFH
jgi:hypothetical protein